MLNPMVLLRVYHPLARRFLDDHGAGALQILPHLLQLSPLAKEKTATTISSNTPSINIFIVIFMELFGILFFARQFDWISATRHDGVSFFLISM